MKAKCIEQRKTQAKPAEEIDTARTCVNRVINNTFVKMMEARGYDEDTYCDRYAE